MRSKSIIVRLITIVAFAPQAGFAQLTGGSIIDEVEGLLAALAGAVEVVGHQVAVDLPQCLTIPWIKECVRCDSLVAPHVGQKTRIQ